MNAPIWENTSHNWITILRPSTLLNFSPPVPLSISVFSLSPSPLPFRLCVCCCFAFECTMAYGALLKFIKPSHKAHTCACVSVVPIQMQSKSAFDLYAIVSFNDALCHTIYAATRYMCQSEGYRYGKSVERQNSLTNRAHRLLVGVFHRLSFKSESLWVFFCFTSSFSLSVISSKKNWIKKWFMHLQRWQMNPIALNARNNSFSEKNYL